MAHRSSQRRNLKASQSLTTSSPSHHPTPNPDLTRPYKPSFLVKHLSSLNLAHKHTPLVDTRLQTKTMTTSAIVDTSKTSSLLKPNTHNTRLAPEPAQKTHKEKPHKPCLELERRKLHGLIKKDPGYEVEDVKIEKSRNFVVEKYDVVERVSVSLAPSGGRRRSFCGSQVDLGDVFAINGAKMVSADMPPFMQIHAVDCARKAFDSMEKFTSKTLALSLKKEFDGVYGPAWHCIVGTSFGSFVTHSVGGFLYFSMDQKLYILLFKTAVQKAG
ncbi:uncharacterized protein LOC113847721 isoform X1 [Abrus precatorius]|uniref:Uncharacterized protein LOC113847721 isoform X1 n=1 Tax=Abrus precatorius TaxID=3816 RepID=A0A8B8JNC4_ABRPR|nr:uncharacterized protein LOC113847721 isoform X1 [Abrus precatorius]